MCFMVPSARDKCLLASNRGDETPNLDDEAGLVLAKDAPSGRREITVTEIPLWCEHVSTSGTSALN